jgi:hypothetical protein
LTTLNAAYRGVGAFPRPAAVPTIPGTAAVAPIAFSTLRREVSRGMRKRILFTGY